MNDYHPIYEVSHKIATHDITIYFSVSGRRLIIHKDHFNNLEIRLPDCNYLLNELGNDLVRRLNVT